MCRAGPKPEHYYYALCPVRFQEPRLQVQRKKAPLPSSNTQSPYILGQRWAIVSLFDRVLAQLFFELVVAWLGP